MKTMMIGLLLPMAVTQIDYHQLLLNVHIVIQLSQSIRLFWTTTSTLSFFPSLRPERKRGRGARFNRGGGHFSSVTQQLRTDQTFANRLEHVVQTTLRDEQITSDATNILHILLKQMIMH